MNLKYQLLNGSSATNGRRDKKVRGRYAPSPSGVQHMGNIQTAILAWLQARLVGGDFILRMDDVDTPRVKLGSAAQIIEDLRWLGMDWDALPCAMPCTLPNAQYQNTQYQADSQQVYAQSAHLAHYQQAFDQLRADGYLYACTCSRKRIAQLVGKPNQAGHYIYPGTCRDKNHAESEHEKAFAWRFALKDESYIFEDEIMGKQTQNAALDEGDFVVKRRDSVFAYHLASVVDDISLGMTDVLRGEDLLGSTACQAAIFQALGAEPPRFWHVPLKLNRTGEKLSKRNGSDSLQSLRENGMTAERVIGQLAFDLGLIEQENSLSLLDLCETLRK